MKALAVDHQDQITAVSYDFYGRRMATCSVDHTIKVFDRVDDQWRLNDSWRAHEAPIVRLSWAGPKHSALLASASHDCTVKLWEENCAEPQASARRWRRRYTISDFKGPLYDVEFAPRGQGLKLAAIAADGVLRMYEALDPNNLGYWTVMAQESLLNRPVARQLQSSFALCWSPTPSFEDWIVVCVLEDVLLFRRDSTTNKYVKVAMIPGHKGLIRDVSWAPSFGRSLGLIATACKDGKVRIFTIKRNVVQQASLDKALKLGGASAARAPTSKDPEQKRSDNEKPVPVEPVQGFKIGEGPQPQTEDVEINLVHESADHGGEVWKVSWNVSGTILASAGDDAKIRFWKSPFSGPFQCMAVINGSDKILK